MPQINMTIVAESAEELRNILVDLANIVEAAGMSEAPSAAPPAIVTSAGEAPRRRGRPRKADAPAPTPEESPARAELEKIKAEQAASEAQAAAVEAPAVTIAPLPPAVEPEAAPPVAEAPAPLPTVEAVREALKALVNAKGRDAAVKLLSDAKYEKLSDVPPQMYGEIIAKATAAAK